MAVEKSVGSDRGDIVDQFGKRKASTVERGGVTVVGVDRVSAWAGQDRHRTFNDVETFGNSVNCTYCCS